MDLAVKEEHPLAPVEYLNMPGARKKKKKIICISENLQTVQAIMHPQCSGMELATIRDVLGKGSFEPLGPR